MQTSDISLEQVKNEQINNKFYASIREKISENEESVPDFIIVDDLLYKLTPKTKKSQILIQQLCITEKHVDKLINYVHDLSHSGIANTYNLFKESYYCHNAYIRCKKFVEKYGPCKLRKLKRIE